jgi:2-phosphosulfolactate phosphatase
VDVTFGVPNKLSEVMVIIDVFRSSTAIVSFLDNGAKYIVPCKSTEDVRKLKNMGLIMEGAILVGEEMGVTPKGFNLNISPSAIRKELIQNKVLIFSSTNLTRILHYCSSAKIVLIGGLINAKAIAKYLEIIGPKDVGIVACGVLPLQMVTLEDIIGAGAIAHKIDKGEFSDTAIMSCLVYQNSKWKELIYSGYVAKYLTKIGFEEDVRFCLQEDVSNTVPIFKNGQIIRLKEVESVSN